MVESGAAYAHRVVTQEERLEVRARCSRWLSNHGHHLTMREWLTDLAAMPGADGRPDVYGAGEAVHALERDVAELLGKPAGRFVIKGMIAQQATLRAWTDQRGFPTVALHPLSHLDFDELNAIERLHPLRAIRLGRTAPFGVAELDAVGEPIGAVTVELPLRRAGFALPSWDELAAVSEWCREHEVPLHLDGARLWESAPYYGRSLAAIAALADSVYVSFYKGLGGLAGCVLAGTDELLKRATPWLTRHGANVYAAFPYALAARAGLDRHLPRMADYRGRAQTLARALGELPGVRVTEPQTNSFGVYLPGDHQALDEAQLRLAERSGVWLFGLIGASPVPGLAVAEVMVGEATEAVPDDEAAELTRQLLAEAERHPTARSDGTDGAAGLDDSESEAGAA